MPHIIGSAKRYLLSAGGSPAFSWPWSEEGRHNERVQPEKRTPPHGPPGDVKLRGERDTF